MNHCHDIKFAPFSDLYFTFKGLAQWFLRTDDTFPIFSSEKFSQPPPFEDFLEINFQFSMVSILHREGYDHQ
jgi:hypothetical protein